MVHVGATDAPVTIDECEEVMDEMADNGIEAAICSAGSGRWAFTTRSPSALVVGGSIFSCARSRARSWSGSQEADAVRFFELAYVDLDVDATARGVRRAEGLRHPERGPDPGERPRADRRVVGSDRLLVGRLRLPRRDLPQPVAGLPDAG